MKASELRIGNWVLTCTPNMQIMIPHITAKVQGITLFRELMFCYEPTNNLGFNMPDIHVTGIPLTEEWLVKFGFKGQQVYESVSDYWIPDGYRTKGHKVQTDGETFVFMGYKDGTEIQYVHQLQNLYFALTGTELTIK